MIENFTVENKYHLDVVACAYAEYFGKTKPQESIKRMFGRPPGLWSRRRSGIVVDWSRPAKRGLGYTKIILLEVLPSI